jgi:hypothetical protein
MHDINSYKYQPPLTKDYIAEGDRHILLRGLRKMSQSPAVLLAMV